MSACDRLAAASHGEAAAPHQTTIKYVTSRNTWLIQDSTTTEQETGGAPALPPKRTTKGNTMTKLPTWDELSDLDKGAALLHIHKREWEGAEYAVENYPAEFFDHPALVAVDSKQASEYAAKFDGPVPDMDPDEYARLYDAALDADDKRSAARRNT